MSDEVVDTPFGKFLVDPLDCVGMTTKAGTLWDGAGFLQPIAHEYGELGTKGVTILDVGANIGTYSVWLARMGAWRVIAVEPVPETLLYLKANLDLNKATCADHVIPLELAAYDHTARMTMVSWDRHNMGGTSLVPALGGPIQGDRLDNWAHCFGDRVSLIKVDAQGCDGRALVGLSATIQRDHPVIVFEWEAGLAVAHGLSLDDVTGWLALQEYVVHPWPCYANNFLARHRSKIR